MASSDRDARIAKLERELLAVAEILRDEKLPDTATIAEQFVRETFALLRASLSREAEAKKDAERLATFASLLEQSARAKMEGMIEVIFAVMPPDGGSIGVSFGADDPAEGSSALDALRNLLDSSRAVSLSEGGSK